MFTFSKNKLCCKLHKMIKNFFFIYIFNLLDYFTVLIIQLHQTIVCCHVTNMSLQLLFVCVSVSGGGRAHVLFEVSPAAL